MKRDRSKRSGNQKGFTLVELMIVVVIIGILTAITVPLYQSVQSRARTARAIADIRTVAAAMVEYATGCAGLPGTAGDVCAPGGAAPNSLLTVQNNPITGQNIGPFFGSLPTPPQGWGANYSVTLGACPGPTCGAFQVTAGPPTNGDNGGVALIAP